MKKDNTLKCLQCSKLLLINNNYTNDILFHKDKICCDTKNNKIKNIVERLFISSFFLSKNLAKATIKPIFASSDVCKSIIFNLFTCQKIYHQRRRA